ncbi:MAG: TolC family protein [Bacteroidales bacterium]|nr:TolC family protein [Bacteroidales bacterium]
MTSKIKKLRLLASLLSFTSLTYAQQPVLDSYIGMALKSNLALKEKQSSYEKSLLSLKEAKGLFMPNLSLQARYTVAEGGRTIEFPVGDMLNPVYSTLNALTGSDQFPQIPNQEFNFYRPTEQETKLHLVQPIYNPQIKYNKKIKEELANTEKADAETYKRYLVAEVKTAYFNYLKAIQINGLLDKTKTLLEENIRVNEKLYANNMVTLEYVYRSKSELSKLEQQKAEALKGKKMAEAYFNFLLNKPLESEIEQIDTLTIPSGFPSVDPAQNMAMERREELQMLNYYQNITQYNYSLNSKNRLPTIAAVVDYGFQGTRYEFTGDYDYILATIALQWPIFTGFQNKSKIQQSLIEKDIIANKQIETENKIKLEVQNAFYSLQSAEQSIKSAKDQEKTAKEAYRLMEKKYGQGQANLLEYIDARNTMTSAEINLIIAEYNFYIEYANYERTACLFDLTPYENQN